MFVALLATLIVGGMVTFPIRAVVLAVAMVFDPWLGFAYSLFGSTVCMIPSRLFASVVGDSFAAAPKSPTFGGIRLLGLRTNGG